METTTKEGGKSLIESMFEAGVHLGYSRGKRHPTFKAIVFGQKNGVDVVDLEKTNVSLSKALEFVKNAASEGKTMLLVGTKPEARGAVENAAHVLHMPHVLNRWIGGTLTNFSEIKKRVARMEDLLAKKEAGELDVYTKKERILIDREIEKLKLYFWGIRSMKQLPDFIFIIDPKHESTATREARRKKLPIVALAGTDCNLEEISFPIPGNDASMPSIAFFVKEVTKAYEEGKKNPKPVEISQPAPSEKSKK